MHQETAAITASAIPVNGGKAANSTAALMTTSPAHASSGGFEDFPIPSTVRPESIRRG